MVVQAFFIRCWREQAVQPVVKCLMQRAQPDSSSHFRIMFRSIAQAFFIRWWREQAGHRQRLVQRLVRRRQLEFINGGYVQNDEAASHYVAMIDQTARGHRSPGLSHEILLSTSVSIGHDRPDLTRPHVRTRP